LRFCSRLLESSKPPLPEHVKVSSSYPLSLGCSVACGRPPVDMLARKQNTETGYMCKSSKSTGKRGWLTVVVAAIIVSGDV
jgi:hypothetical protein